MKVSLVVLLMLAAIACSQNGGGGATPKQRAVGETVPVTVAQVVERPMPVELRVVGTVEPSATVAVRPQVGGQLVRVHFTEGQEVKQGDVLFVIDSRPFETALHQAEANLAKDTAQANNAASQVRRYRDLAGRGIATREQLDQVSTSAAALQSTVQADAAAVETAKLQLDYATIRAPIGGRTGALLVHPGNVVRTTDTQPLVVINQLCPIWVTFSVPEASLADMRRYQATSTLHVNAELPGANAPVEHGVISFIDNTVDRATGTIKVKGTFQNAERHLWPGLFVNVVLTLNTEPRALVVPSRAVQEAQQGTYVYAVKADRTVETRQVKVLRTIGDQAVVAGSVTPGETVVTDGHLRLVPGKKVSFGREPQADRGASNR